LNRRKYSFVTAPRCRLSVEAQRCEFRGHPACAGAEDQPSRQYGREFPPRPATRIRQMEEAVQLILKVWTEPRTTLHGRVFHVKDAIPEPKPVQKPRPPVRVAGGGEQITLRAVARLADACNIVGGNLATVRHTLAVLRSHEVRMQVGDLGTRPLRSWPKCSSARPTGSGV
jgi:hypothetical protein